MTDAADADLGVYVHVPFCAHHCDYCDFAVVTGAQRLIPRYIAALLAEVDAVTAGGPSAVAPSGTSAATSWPAVTSIFVGGGTPTLLPAGGLARVLRHIRNALPVASDAEVTIEANPETVTVPYLETLLAAGLTRISIGVQSFDPKVLATLGRRHAPEHAVRAVADAHGAGVASVNLDMIYGTPGETDAGWRTSLSRAIDTAVDHLSAYALTIEPNTVYAARARRDPRLLPDEDVQADRMAAADELLAANGFTRYEVSNWAHPGAQSVHNRTYWRGGNWLAFGAAAHGHYAGRRWWNVRPATRYVDEVLAGRAPLGGEEVVDAPARRAERLLTGLRTLEGVALEDVAPLDVASLDALVHAGLLRMDGGRLHPTAGGFAVADALAVRLL